MGSRRIDTARIHSLNQNGTVEGRYVLYWMQQSQRGQMNHALEYAIRRANGLGLPVIVGFGVMDGYPEANLRHYRFMIEGLHEVAATLHRRGVGFVLRHGDPPEVALELGADAALIVCDVGYLRHQKRWRQRVAEEAAREVVQVESDVVVPVETTSGKAEFAARTIRPKIHRQLKRFLDPLTPTPARHSARDLRLTGLDAYDPEGLLARLDIDQSVRPVGMFPGGNREARRVLGRFLRGHLSRYSANRNRPQTSDVSHMGKYLHFGHISPVYVANRVTEAQAAPEDVNAYLEELIVRRELAINFVHFTPNYDRFECLPDWARRTLEEHRKDPRPHRYTPQQLEDAETHDPYWNAAMREMRYTGYMHNYMRMYWGKKILEWSASPEQAHRAALTLNNKYFIDGRDPNSYAGVNWVFGLHDRPWAERAIFGKVRYMAESGLRRKADPDAYVAKVDRLVAEAASE